jgi:hypothetical protein
LERCLLHLDRKVIKGLFHGLVHDLAVACHMANLCLDGLVFLLPSLEEFLLELCHLHHRVYLFVALLDSLLKLIHPEKKSIETTFGH